VIHLIGPGGAGKSAVAPHVATLLGCPVIDLDRAFEALHGDIDHFIGKHGYAVYAAANVATYLTVRSSTSAVVALSSGFMVYSTDVYPGLHELRRELVAAPTTVLLLPSLDLEICVAETVRRQRERNLTIRRSSVREETVIRERSAQYRSLTERIVTTMQSPAGVARDVLDCIGVTLNDGLGARAL